MSAPEYTQDTATWCDRCTVPRADCGHPDPSSDGEQHRGQLRMAYRLAGAYHGRLMHVHGMGWMAWDGTHWIEDTGQAARAVHDVLRIALAGALGDHDLQADVRKCESASGVAGVLELAAPLDGIAVTVDQLDADPYLLNTASGTLDLHTMMTRPHDPADHLTRITRAAWEPEDHDGEWTTFLAAVLPDPDVRGYLQRFIGMSLLGRVRDHVITIATGTGRNGKSTFTRALLHALGDYGHTAERDLFADRRSNPNGASPALLGLRGRRLAVVSETEAGQRLAPALLKQLTGGDPITARPLYGRPVTFEPSHASLMVTNHLPRLPADDPAVWRRVRVVPFDVVIPDGEEDHQLPERLEAEADAVLRWAVAGLRDYLTGGLSEPDAVRAATAAYEREQDDVARWIDAMCVTGPDFGAIATVLHAAYRAWAEADGVERPLSARDFGASLDRLGHPVKRTKRARIREGIDLAENNRNAVTSRNDEGVTRVTHFDLNPYARAHGEVMSESVTSVTRPPEECPNCGDSECEGECR